MQARLETESLPSTGARPLAPPAPRGEAVQPAAPPLAMRCLAVVVNHDTGDHVVRCVQSLLAEGVDRVVVVDNASQPEEVARLRRFAARWPARLGLIENADNRGFAAACNQGARQAGSDTVFFLNPDAVLLPGALSTLQEALAADSRIGMVGGLLCNPDGSEQPGGRRVFPTPRRGFVRAFGLARFARRWPRLFSDFLLHEQPLPPGPQAVEAISGACMLMRREALDGVGGWDEDYFLHAEDLDLCMRLADRRWAVHFVPEARIVHAKGVSSRARPYFVAWHKHLGMLIFYRKHFRQRYAEPLWWGVCAAVSLRLLAVWAGLAWRGIARRRQGG